MSADRTDAAKGRRYPGMRYQVRIIEPNTPGRWWRKPKAGQTFNYGSSETLDGAYVLLDSAPFWIGERVVLEDQEDGSWIAIKRGRVAA